MKKILIIYVSAGSGHITAAKALTQALAKQNPQTEFMCIDALDYTSFLHRKVYAESYLSLVNNLPSLWGYFYDQFDKKNTQLVTKFMNFMNKINASALYKFINEYKPDHIISTHFLSAELLNSQKKLRIPNSVVITDYDAHNFWMHDSVDHYFVATDDVKHRLVHHGIDKNKVSVTGIPVRDIFQAKYDREATRKKFNLKHDKTILLMIGTYIGRGEDMVEVLAKIDQPYNLVVGTGRNTDLKAKLAKIKINPKVNYQVYGYIENPAELMSVCDVIVSKSGGLTVAESFVMGLPMIIIDPIPGQEERNADYIIEIGAGHRAHSLISLETRVGRLLKNPAKLTELKKNALIAARPDAAKQIIAKVMEML